MLWIYLWLVGLGEQTNRGVFRGGPGLSRLWGGPCGHPPVLWDLPPTLEALPAAMKLPQLFSAPLFSSPGPGGGQQGGWT